jgi:hypothetical protein
MSNVNANTTHAKLALTACSPAFRGYLADVDARWDVIAGSVDDRTEEERGLKVATLKTILCGRADYP